MTSLERTRLERASPLVKEPSARSRGRRSRRLRAILSCGVTEKGEILAALRAALSGLKRRWPIRFLAIFGSFVRGDASPKSDLDVLVEFERPLCLSEFLALEDTLSVLADRRVDLVTRDALRLHIGRRVLAEAVRL